MFKIRFRKKSWQILNPKFLNVKQNENLNFQLNVKNEEYFEGGITTCYAAPELLKYLII